MKCLKMVANKYGWSRVTREQNRYYKRFLSCDYSACDP